MQDDTFDLGFFFPNNPFGPITNERTNDICIHIAIFYSILFCSSIPLTLFPPVFLSFFVFPFIGLTLTIHPVRLQLFMYTLPFRLPCRFLYPPSTDVLVNFKRSSRYQLSFFMPHTYYRFILSTLVYLFTYLQVFFW